MRYTRIAAKVVNGHVVLQLNDAETRMLPARAVEIAALILKAAQECLDSADGRLELNPSQECTVRAAEPNA
jgi:hypothetical protein